MPGGQHFPQGLAQCRGAMKGEASTAVCPPAITWPGWKQFCYLIFCPKVQTASASKTGKSVNLGQNSSPLGMGTRLLHCCCFCPHCRWHFHLCQRDGTGSEVVPVPVGTRANPARGTVWPGAVRGPMMCTSSSSTRLLAAFKQREGTSVPALQQPHQVLSFHSKFCETLLALVSHPAVMSVSWLPKAVQL